MTITCKYSCAGCGLNRVELQVEARTVEDVSTWMEKVFTPAISDDHSRRSPFCASRTMSEVMIPVTGADKIGGPAVN